MDEHEEATNTWPGELGPEGLGSALYHLVLQGRGSRFASHARPPPKTPEKSGTAKVQADCGKTCTERNDR